MAGADPPLYAMGLVILYYRPQALPPSLEEELAEGMFKLGWSGESSGRWAAFLLFPRSCWPLPSSTPPFTSSETPGGSSSRRRGSIAARYASILAAFTEIAQSHF